MEMAHFGGGDRASPGRSSSAQIGIVNHTPQATVAKKSTTAENLKRFAENELVETLGHIVAALRCETDEKIKRLQDEANAKIAALEQRG